MSTNKWIAKLAKLEGAITEDKDPFAKIISTFSPSVNFVFGNTHGLPQGYMAVLYGPPKGGKSVLSHMMAGHIHQVDPEAIVMKFDTEFRSHAQLTPKAMKTFGIDPGRFMKIQTNSPSAVFDQIEADVGAHCESGMPLRLIIIDSVSGVQGRREMNLDSVEKMTIGDHAQTVQIGLKRILPIIRKYDIALVVIAQVRAEMDQTEQMRGNKVKMQASFGLQHMSEYFIAVEQNKTKGGRVDAYGKEFINDDVTDMAGKGELTAVKIRVKMKDSSLGPKGRTGEFTYDFAKGVVNTYEEAFKLGVARNIIERPNLQTYKLGDEVWRGQEACINAFRESPELCEMVISELKRQDLTGEYTASAELADSDDE